jgi:hypothetical protein
MALPPQEEGGELRRLAVMISAGVEMMMTTAILVAEAGTESVPATGVTLSAEAYPGTRRAGAGRPG